MASDFFSKNKVLLTILSALIVLAHLIFEYFHGGIVTHYFMQNGNLPGISNVWGLVSFTLFVWVALLRIERRKSTDESNNSNKAVVFYRLLSAIIFGVLVSYLFSNNSSLLDYLMLGLFGLSVFVPLYFVEYLIGFTIGTMYMFGANIPLIGGLILLFIFLVLFKLPRIILRIIRSKLA